MGSPRLQISLRKVLIIVAVVALNCWAYRSLYRIVEDVRRASPPSTEPENIVIAIGSLPLLNVALIGTLLYVARRFRSFRRGREANPRPAPAAVTYFSLHFLALGFVIITFMPSLMRIYVATLVPVEDYWKAEFDRYPVAFSTFVIECSTLGVLISGPPLLLSWIGRKLAGRSAATLTPRRFGVMTCLVSFGFASVAVAIWMRPRPFAQEQDVDLQFQIVDNDSGQPISAVTLRITDPFDSTSTPPTALTDSDGRAQLTGRFQAIGERIAFGTIGVFSPWGRWLELSAPQRQSVRIPLTDVLGPDVELERARPRKVHLTRGKSPDNSFQDIAGTYSMSEHLAGWRFDIEQDGRFLWAASYCEPPADHECGYLKRKGEAIEVVPIPHPGREYHPMLPLRLQSIRWGARLYLSTMEDHELYGFCRAALNLKPPPNAYYTFGGYLRDSDRAKLPSGLPRLPLKVWVKFMLEELRLRNEQTSLRLPLEYLILGTSADG